MKEQKSKAEGRGHTPAQQFVQKAWSMTGFMRKWHFGKINSSVFILSLLTILIPVFLCAGFFAAKLIEKNAFQYTREKNEQIRFISENIKKEMELISDMSNDILYQKWLSKYTNHIDLYQDEFTLMSKQDIYSSLSTKLTSTAYLEDIYIIVPSKQTVITPNGWFSEAEFGQFNPQISMDGLTKAEAYASGYRTTLVTSSNSDDVIISFVNAFLADRDCCVSFVINLPKLNAYLDRLGLGQFSGITARFFQAEAAEGKAVPVDEKAPVLVVEMEIVPQVLDLRFSYPAYRNTMETKELLSSFILVAAFTLVSVLLSLFLTMKISAPLERLLRSISTQRFSSAKESFDYLNQYFSDMIQSNHSLELELNHYKVLAKRESLLAILTDESFVHSKENIESIFPWTKEKNTPYVLMAFQPIQLKESFDKKEIEGYFRDSGLPYYMVEVFANDICLILWVEDEQLFVELQKKLKAATASHWHAVFSEQQQDITKIQECYTDIRFQLSSLLKKQSPEHVAPAISQEIAFIQAITDNQEECTAILQGIVRAAGDKEGICSYLWELLKRIAADYEIQLPESQEQVVLSEDALMQNALYLGKMIELDKKKTSSNTFLMIREYIDNNYTNPEISLKFLSDIFSIHSSLLSKMFKNHFSVNFSDYLLELRVQKAKGMLQDTALSVSLISERVGYANYLSFKRAFIRATGISPKEYREELSH